MHMPNVPGLRWKRRRAGLRINQGTAAEALGITKRTLQNIETNPGQVVSREVIWRAESFYGVTEAWLLGEGDDDKPEEKSPEESSRREPPGDPSGPPPRPDRDRKGPPRSADELRAAS